jgi:hypothetical protein
MLPASFRLSRSALKDEVSYISDNKSLENGDRANSQNILYIKYVSDIGQYPK